MIATISYRSGTVLPSQDNKLHRKLIY